MFFLKKLKSKIVSNPDNHQYQADICTKLYRSLIVRGWFYSKGETLRSISIKDPNITYYDYNLNLPWDGVSSLGSNLGYEINAILSEDSFPITAEVIFKTDKSTLKTTCDKLIKKRSSIYDQSNIFPFFSKLVKSYKDDQAKILDIGGRDRSRLKAGFSSFFPSAKITCLDIVDEEGVDVVGDAHELSTYFERGYFDYVVSNAVFEHLAMPWKVAIEISKILKINGFAFIATHQTIGLHDQPWDFFRFSDESWKAIFNRYTGFEIISTEMNLPSFIIPHLYHPAKIGCEGSVGYEASTVIIKKVSEPSVEWDISIRKILESSYPKNEDNNTLQRKFF